MKYTSIIVGALETNCYIVYCENTGDCGIIDPGADAQKIIRLIAENNLNPVILINTHGHVDHIGANQDIKDKYDIPLYIHADDVQVLNSSLQSEMALILGAKKSPPPDEYLKEQDVLTIGEVQLEVLHTPGHSPGSVCFIGDNYLFSGDTLFCGGVGRTDLPGGSWDDLVSSIRNKLFNLDDIYSVLPGHGPASSIFQEKNSNPYVR